MGGQPPDFLGFAFPVSAGITLRSDQRMEPAFGIGRQVRRSGELLEALACFTQLGQQRGDAPHALQLAALFGQGPNLPLHAGQFGHGRGVRPLSFLPGARCDGAFLGFALCPTPGGIGKVTPAAAVANQRLCLVIKPRQRRTKVEQASAGEKAFPDLAAKPQEFAATFAQACA
ncbi:MAG: hypothetical protein WB509_11265, partial [Acetobacteraceae bacterium]